MPWKEAKLVVDPKMRTLCVHPYPGHPKGCPNHGRRDNCPPKVQMIGTFLDLSKPTWVIWNDFDMAAHASRMTSLHPGWSDRQVYCCLWWQPKARTILRGIIKEFWREHRELSVSPCPEAMGVNLTETMRGIGIELEWPPRKIARQIVVAGSKFDRSLT